MDQRDFTKNYRNTSKVEHEGGDSLNEDQAMDKNSIEDDDERNSPQKMADIKIERLDKSQSPKRSRTVTDGFRSKAAVDPPIIKIQELAANKGEDQKVMVPGEASVSQKSKAGLSKSMEKTKPGKDEILCKKCPTCKIVKTPRVYHCPICDVCVSVHDHHCPMIGACIG